MYRLLVEQVDGFAIILLDPGGQVLSWNSGAKRIHGHRPDQIIGHHFSCLYPPEEVARGKPENELNEAKARGHFQDEGWRVRSDGSRFWADIVTTAIRGAAGELIGFAKLSRDRTERKTAEEAWHLAEERRQLERERETRAAAERAERRASFLARASEILGSSLEYEDTLGSVARLAVPQIADGCAIALHTEDGSIDTLGLAHLQPSMESAVRELLQRLVADPASTAGPGSPRAMASELHAEIDSALIQRLAGDGDDPGAVRDLGLRSMMIVPLAARDHPIGVMLFVGTRPDRSFGPEDLSVVEDLGRRTSIAIDNARLYREVREADRRKDQWLAMLAHELRNPMATVVTSVHILRMSGSDPRQVEGARATIERQVRQLTRLLDELLDVSRISRGRIGIRRERLDLVKLVRTASEDFRAALGHVGLRLVLELETEPLWMAGDSVRLTQVLNNLLDNSAKFKGKGKVVQVRLTPDRAHHEAVLEVVDEGIGIAPEILPLLFDPFAQGERSLDRSPGGLGIGLAMVKGLVELHGGTVGVESRGVGKGARFTVRLPLKREPAALAEMPSVVTDGTSSALRILVIEDNPDAAQSLCILLELLGHEVQVAHNGLEGLRRARDWVPDVVLCDIGLPGLDGYEVAGELRRDPPTARTRLIAVTGYGQESDRERSRTAGFDHHLVKPVDPALLQRILSTPERADRV